MLLMKCVNQRVHISFVLQVTAGESQGELNAKLAFELVGRITCLTCSKSFAYFASYAKHAKWCGQEVRSVVAKFCMQGYL
jgi:hypothetical protein